MWGHEPWRRLLIYAFKSNMFAFLFYQEKEKQQDATIKQTTSYFNSKLFPFLFFLIKKETPSSAALVGAGKKIKDKRMAPPVYPALAT